MNKTLMVEGMTCQHCEKSVHDALTNIDGVESVKINLDSGKVDVSFDESMVTEAALEEAVEEQGYDVTQ